MGGKDSKADEYEQTAKKVAALVDAANRKDALGETPLLRAATKGYTEMMASLLKEKADVNLSDELGNSPLARAAMNGHVDAVKTLIGAGADINLTNDNGKHAMLEACIAGQNEAVRLLIGANSNVSSSDAGGRTGLMFAAKHNHPDVISTLLSAGANTDAVDQLNHSVFDFVMKLDILPILWRLFRFQKATFIEHKDLSKIAERSSDEVSTEYTALYSYRQTPDGPANIPILCRIPHTSTATQSWHELTTLSNIPYHENIDNLMAVCAKFESDPKYVKPTALVFVRKEGGSFLEFLKSRKDPLSYNQILRFSSDIAQAVSHLHANNIKHCDIATRNFVLSSDPASEANTNAGVIPSIALQGFSLALGIDEYLTPSRFPPLWSAPEVLKSCGIDTSTAGDIWMLGITLMELIAHPYRQPFGTSKTVQDLMNMFDKGVHLEFPKQLPDTFQDLIESCCHKIPSKRPNAQEVTGKIADMIQQYEEEQKASSEAEMRKKLAKFTQMTAHQKPAATAARRVDRRHSWTGDQIKAKQDSGAETSMKQNSGSVEGKSSDVGAPRKDEKVLVFTSDKIGMRFNASKITQVSKGGEAEQKGVQIGWEMLIINNTPCEKKTAGVSVQLKDAQKTGSVTVVFSTQPEESRRNEEQKLDVQLSQKFLNFDLRSDVYYMVGEEKESLESANMGRQLQMCQKQNRSLQQKIQDLERKMEAVEGKSKVLQETLEKVQAEAERQKDPPPPAEQDDQSDKTQDGADSPEPIQEDPPPDAEDGNGKSDNVSQEK